MADGSVDSSRGDRCLVLELLNHCFLLACACMCVSGYSRTRTITAFVKTGNCRSMDWSAAALSALARATIASLCGAGGVDVEGDVKGDVAPRTAASVLRVTVPVSVVQRRRRVIVLDANSASSDGECE